MLNPLDIYLNFVPVDIKLMRSDYKALLIDQLIDLLPHGAGIDADWDIEVFSNYFICSNSYHLMSEFGMYLGWMDFSVVLIMDSITKKIKRIQVMGDELDKHLLIEDNPNIDTYELNLITDYIHESVLFSLKDYYGQ